MGTDLYVRREPSRDAYSPEISYDLVSALLSADSEVRPYLAPALVRRLAPDWGNDPASWSARDPAALRADFEAVRASVIDHNDVLPVRYTFPLRNGSSVGSGAIVPFREMDYTDPSDRLARLVTEHGDPDHRGDLRVEYLSPHPDARAWVRRYRSRSTWARTRDAVRSRWLFLRGPIPNAMGGEPRPPPPHFVEESAEWLPIEPVIEVLGERVEVAREDAVSRYVPSLDLAIGFCEDAARAGRPVFWTAD